MMDTLLRLVFRREAKLRGAQATSVPPGVAVRVGRLIPAIGGRLAGMGRHAAAVTLGRTIVVHPNVTLTPRLLRHELAHVRQWTEYPFTFPLRYVWNHLRHGYRDNPFEVQAREAEQQQPRRRT